MANFVATCRSEYQRWVTALRGHHKFVLKVLFLGTISGFPQILFFSLLPLWLKAGGMSLKSLAFFGAVGTFFAFNWVLAPLMDGFTAFNLERRRFWLLISQSFMTVMCFALAFTGMHIEGSGLVVMSFFVVLIALGSAMQDVSIDALRIEITPEGREDLLAFGSSLGVIGWWTGFSLGGWLGLHIFSALNGNNATTATTDWQSVYYILGILMAVVVGLTQWVFRNRKPVPLAPLPQGAEWVAEVFKRPFLSFVHSKGWKLTLMVLAFLFLFKLGEAFLGRMAIVFYKHVGYTETEIADYVKFFGWIFTVIFTLIGGFLAGSMGVWRGMMIGGIAMASTNLLFALIAVVKPPSVALLLFTVISDNLTTAFATVSTVTFISALCDRHYTASQYALFASIATAGRTLVASSAGILVEDVFNHNWALFFIFTTVMVVPSLILLWFMRQSPIFNFSQNSQPVDLNKE